MFDAHVVFFSSLRSFELSEVMDDGRQYSGEVVSTAALQLDGPRTWIEVNWTLLNVQKRAKGCLCLCGPVMSWRLVQVVTQPSTCDSWDYWKWMGKWRGKNSSISWAWDSGGSLWFCVWPAHQYLFFQLWFLVGILIWSHYWPCLTIKNVSYLQLLTVWLRSVSMGVSSSTRS